MATCRSCGARIVWAVTAAGKRMPLDAEPDARGNVRLLPDGSCEVLSRADLEGEVARLYRPHHSTCPDARTWRR